MKNLGSEQTVAERLLLSRRLANLDQVELARRADVSNGYISDIERRKVSNVGIEVIESLAKALGVPPQWLAGWGDDSLLSSEVEKLDEESRKLIDVYEQLDNKQKALLIEMAKLLKG